MMAREIKFRAWDGHRMRDWKAIGGTLGFHHWLYNCPDSVNLMQYTGLKDKNGKEIYEGDILGENTADENYIYGQVAFNATPDCIYAGQYYLTDKDGYATDWDDNTGENWHNLEIFGNQYENPELVE